MKCAGYFGPLRCKCHRDQHYYCMHDEGHIGCHEADAKHMGIDVPGHTFRWEDEYK